MKTEDLSISIQLNSLDNQPIIVKKIFINGVEFLPKVLPNEPEANSLSNSGEKTVLVATTIPEQDSSPQNDKTIGEKKKEEEIERAADTNTLEEFGGNDFYKPFFGKLKYQPLGNGTTKITLEGEGEFDHNYVGKFLEPSRIHRCSVGYPRSGKNYFPGTLSVVYSRVLSVEDSKNILVDFEYNGGDSNQPKSIQNQDGIFFHDNKFALESWSNSPNRKSNLVANPGQTYAVLGIPKLVVQPDSEMNFKSLGTGIRPAIHWMISDAFDGDENGRGIDVPGSFAETFGDNSAFFHLPGEGKVSIDFDWQLLPPNYSHKVVQYGAPLGVFFLDKANSSKQYGLKRVANYDQFRIRDLMKKELGFLRNGATFSMPSQGYCNGGGINDGAEVKEFCTYRFEGDWVSKNPNNLKARTSGGLLIEWIGHSKDKLGMFVEQESAKTSKFSGLKLKFTSKNQVEVDHPDFNWYHFASQEWTGGTSTGSELTTLEIEGYKIGLNTNGDFWLRNGEGDIKGRGFSSSRINLFDKIPAKGDILSFVPSDLNNCSLIGKPSPSVLEVWGWSIQENDEFSFQGSTYRVVKVDRSWKTWEQIAHDLSLPANLRKNDRKVNFTKLTLDKEISAPLDQISLVVQKSALEPLLDGRYRENCSAIWDIGNDAPGHLMYTDYNINLCMKNIGISGLIRSTARSIWTETSSDIQGNVTSIPVSPLRELLWKKGDRIVLFDPKSGAKSDLESISDCVLGTTALEIKATNLNQVFPKGSIITTMYSLCQKAEFDNVHFVQEDGSPSYSNRIDYRPQGLRLRQLIENNPNRRVKIIGGRLSWFSNLENQFEPEVELSEHPHLVNPKGAVPVILNPVVKDKKGVNFGFQKKITGSEELFIAYRILSRNSVVDLSNSVLGADLYLSGNGEFVLDNLKSKNFIDNQRDSGVGFNLVFEEKYDFTQKLFANGNGGKVGIMVNSPFKIGSLEIKLTQWDLKPGLFNGGGFQSRQNANDPEYSKYVNIK